MLSSKVFYPPPKVFVPRRAHTARDQSKFRGRGEGGEGIWENFFGKKFSQALSKNFHWVTLR